MFADSHKTKVPMNNLKVGADDAPEVGNMKFLRLRVTNAEDGK